jgi:hypothetical protein
VLKLKLPTTERTSAMVDPQAGSFAVGFGTTELATAGARNCVRRIAGKWMPTLVGPLLDACARPCWRLAMRLSAL